MTWSPFDLVPDEPSLWAEAVQRAVEVTTSSPALSKMFDSWMPVELLALLFYVRSEPAGGVEAVDLTPLRELAEHTVEQDPVELRTSLADALREAGHDLDAPWGQDPVVDVWRAMAAGPVEQLPAFQEFSPDMVYPPGSTALGRTLSQLRELFETLPNVQI